MSSANISLLIAHDLEHLGDAVDLEQKYHEQVDLGILDDHFVLDRKKIINASVGQPAAQQYIETVHTVDDGLRYGQHQIVQIEHLCDRVQVRPCQDMRAFRQRRRLKQVQQLGRACRALHKDIDHHERAFLGIQDKHPAAQSAEDLQIDRKADILIIHR